MKLFVDTANVDEIRQANDMGVICGDTRTSVHGVDDKRFLALKAEAFGLRCEL